MELIITMIGLVYLIGLIVTPILIRALPGLNGYLHETLNTANPAVMATVIWPIMIIVLSIYHIFQFTRAIINWVSGNGFITKSNENYESLTDYEY